MEAALLTLSSRSACFKLGEDSLQALHRHGPENKLTFIADVFSLSL